MSCLQDSLHLEFVDNDRNLLQLDLLCLSESWLSSKEETVEIDMRFKNWNIVFRKDADDNKEHMGMLFLIPKGKQNIWENKFQVKNEIKYKGTSKIQVVDVYYNFLTFSFVYSRVTPTLEEAKKLRSMVKETDFVLGDINLDPLNEKHNKALTEICGDDKVLHLKQLTRLQERQLDHILVKKDVAENVITDSYFHISSDHRCIVLRYSHVENDEKLVEDQRLEDKSKNNPTETTKEVKSERSTEKVKLTTSQPIKKEVKLKQEPPQRKEISKDPYSTLNGKEWLNDLVINKYGELIMQRNQDVFIFSSFFSELFLRQKRPYVDCNKFNKTNNMFEKRLVIFPLLQSSHWFLCYLNNENQELTILDPYIKDLTQVDIQILKKKYIEIMKKLEDDYIKVNFEQLENSGWRELKKTVLFPPTIPEQQDSSNCGVYLLTFSK